MTAATRYVNAKIHITPATPTSGINTPAIAGPIHVLMLEPRFVIDMAAPFDSGAKIDMMAAIGTNPTAGVRERS